MKRFTSFVFLLAALIAACGPAATPVAAPVPLLPTAAPAVPELSPTLPPPTPALTPEPRILTVFAAASLTDAFTEIGHDFEAIHPGVTVALNFAGSQTLSTQLIQGAAVDVFASANKMEMDNVVAANLVLADAPKNFLTNQLVVILPRDNPANVQTLQDLGRPGLKIILADKTVPAGKYALQILDALVKEASFGADFKNKVLSNVVSNETDVKQVVTKVQLGEADAGIVYISDAIAAPELKAIEIPSNLSVIAKYPIAALTNAPQPQLAANFIAYVLSADGRTILRNWGFTPIAP
jgi:molybdate transport system substrate-binding protein